MSRRWPLRSLRARLLLPLLLVVSFTLAGLNLAGAAALRTSLLGRTDAALRDFARRAERPIDTRGLDDPERLRRQLFRLGSGAWFVQVVPPDGAALTLSAGGYLGAPPALSAPARRHLAEDGRPATVAADGADLRYRLLARDLTPGPGPGASRPDRGTLVVAAPLRELEDTLRRLRLIQGVGSSVALALLSAVSLAVVRRGLHPLETMAEAADAIAAGDLGRRVRPAVPDSEVGRLGLALNSMLERIEHAVGEQERSQARLRQFVADASHELRTPLTAILGYTELYQQGALPERADTRRVMGRVADQAGRMQGLVEDLLLLARLDECAAVDRAAVDLSALAATAVADARVMEPGRRIDLAAEPAVVVLGDHGQLEQVLGNLIENVRTHTPPTAVACVRVRALGDRALLEVADTGPGVPADALAHVFDRFYRADPSRSRAKGGSGLGLAIVAAIADAHGGRAEISSPEGAGTTVRVRLPLVGTVA